jgi:hypothetical protein
LAVSITGETNAERGLRVFSEQQSIDDVARIPRVVGRFRVARACMDLQQFIVRGQVLSLMRKALRAASKAPPDARLELRAEIRRCFESSRHHTDRFTVKHLLSDGRVKLKMLQEMVGFTA